MGYQELVLGEFKLPDERRGKGKERAYVVQTKAEEDTVLF